MWRSAVEPIKRITYDKQFDAEYQYGGRDLGAVCAGGRTVFKLWSPEAERVEVSLYRDDASGAYAVRPLSRGGRGVWSLEVE
ncbi:MAG: type I pullulanase, partial [Oscillospiraceae bacterium]|nr:type I pullulanase [Oscillospiraceae bacterium]